MIFDDKIFDVTTFIKKHPGGKEHIINYLGKNITEISSLTNLGSQHSYVNPQGLISDLCIGLLKKN